MNKEESRDNELHKRSAASFLPTTDAKSRIAVLGTGRLIWRRLRLFFNRLTSSAVETSSPSDSKYRPNSFVFFLTIASIPSVRFSIKSKLLLFSVMPANGFTVKLSHKRIKE